MSKYKVLVVGSNELLTSSDSYEEAVEWAKQFAETIGKETCVMEVKSTYSPGVIDSYEAATDYLGEDAKNHQKAMSALEKLIVIAEAWNKQDGFVPDYSNSDQWKYYPWFKYIKEVAGFVYADTTYTATYTSASIGSRLCFKTKERAEQFGKQFINLWNDFLLFR